MTTYQTFFVKSYRWLAVAMLAAVLLAAGSYFTTVAVYATNSSWGAPFILNKTSPVVAQFTAQMLQARTQLDTLKIELDGQYQVRETLVQQKTALESLISRYERALQVEKRVDGSLASQMGVLANEKQRADVHLEAAVKANSRLASALDKELQAGLITEATAAATRTQIATSATALRSEQVSTLTLKGQVAAMFRGIKTVDGASTSTKAVENLARLAEMKSQLGEVAIKLAQLEAVVAAKSTEYRDLSAFMQRLTSSPYYLAANGDKYEHHYAFVPYENESAAVVGAPVYACVLEILWCSKVGTVQAVTQTEEKGRHPLFQRDIRGVLIELALDDKASAKERVLFFGGRPLFL